MLPDQLQTQSQQQRDNVIEKEALPSSTTTSCTEALQTAQGHQLKKLVRRLILTGRWQAKTETPRQEETKED